MFSLNLLSNLRDLNDPVLFCQRVIKYIEIGKKEGATLHTGGERHGSEGFYIQPTIFTDVKPEMTIVKEEIFGPGKNQRTLITFSPKLILKARTIPSTVVVVAKFKDQAELIALANDSSYGLAASVFSRDITTALTTAHALQAGILWLNMTILPEPNVPVGGYKRTSYPSPVTTSYIACFLQPSWEAKNNGSSKLMISFSL